MCIIVDNKNIFIHVPKCAGTTVSSMINNKKISNFKLKKISNKMKRGHFGIYPLYINNLYNNNILHLIIRDPLEWYVSFYLYVKNNNDHPYNIYAKQDFIFFFNNLINLNNINNSINLDNHLKKHVNRKINNQPFFVPYKKYKLVKDDIKKYKYSHNHSDLNILLSERNIDEGLYVYWILFLITKINPLILFSKSKKDIIDNLDKYIVDNINIYKINEISNLVKNLGFKYKNIKKNVSKKNKSYLSYYNDEMIEKIKKHHTIIYHLIDIINKKKISMNNTLNNIVKNNIKDEISKKFITFGAGEKKYIDAGNRIINQAKRTELFDEYKLYTDNDLKNDKQFWEKHGNFIIKNKKGFGLWLWKPYIIKKSMDTLKDGDILLYLDAGIEIDFRKKQFLRKKFEIVKKDYIIGTKALNRFGPEKKWCKMDLILHLDTLDNKYLNTQQRQGGTNMFLVCEKTRNFVKEWYNIACNYHLLNDSPSKNKNLKCFKEHRHDQSIFSLLSKKYNLYSNTVLNDNGCIITFPRNRTGKSRINMGNNNQINKINNLQKQRQHQRRLQEIQRKKLIQLRKKKITTIKKRKGKK